MTLRRRAREAFEFVHGVTLLVFGVVGLGILWALAVGLLLGGLWLVIRVVRHALGGGRHGPLPVEGDGRR